MIFQRQYRTFFLEISSFQFVHRILSIKLTACFSGCSSMVEHHLAKVDVDGSSPFIRSIFFTPLQMGAAFSSGCSSMVEHHLAKVDVDGSSPFIRSISSLPLVVILVPAVL